MPPGKGQTHWQDQIWFPTSPLKAIRAKASMSTVTYDPGTNPSAAAEAARKAEIAIVFAYQWESEGMDLESLALPGNQNALIEQVAAANAHTIIVVESGGPITMPWLDKVNSVLEVWFPGSRGADAVANIIFGDVNPSGKLPVTFPKSEADLPHANIVKPPAPSTTRDGDPEGWKKIAAGLPPFQLTYDEGVKVGYKWYEAEHKQVLFPFGFGLSYTNYEYSNLTLTAQPPGNSVRLTFTVKNRGTWEGAEIAEVYASLPASTGEPPKRLVGWNKVNLNVGESKEVSVEVDPKFLSIFNVEQNAWQLVPGEYTFMVGGSLQSLPLKKAVELK